MSTKKNDKRRYVKLHIKGDPLSAKCTCTPDEAKQLMDDDPDLEICGEVWLTPTEFENLGEFDGW